MGSSQQSVNSPGSGQLGSRKWSTHQQWGMQHKVDYCGMQDKADWGIQHKVDWGMQQKDCQMDCI